jgi:hypothetical protein
MVSAQRSARVIIRVDSPSHMLLSCFSKSTVGSRRWRAKLLISRPASRACRTPSASGTGSLLVRQSLCRSCSWLCLRCCRGGVRSGASSGVEGGKMKSIRVFLRPSNHFSFPSPRFIELHSKSDVLWLSHQSAPRNTQPPLLFPLTPSSPSKSSNSLSSFPALLLGATAEEAAGGARATGAAAAC